jgi:uncharacterized protein
VVLFGGEPLLNWPLAKKVITHCEGLKTQYPDKEMTYFLTTNLTIFPPDLLEWIKRYQISVLVDLDGPEAIHDQCRPYKNGSPSYRRICENIRRLAAEGVSVGLRTTITALNQDYLCEIAQLHKDLGSVGSAFVPVCPVNSDEEILPESMLPSPEKVLSGLLEINRRGIWANEDIHPFSVLAAELSPASRLVSGCGATQGNTVTVDVHGDTYPCIYLVGIRKFHLGNVQDESWPDKEKISWFLDLVRVDHLEDCRGCPWRYYCGGGCPIGHLTIDDNPRASKAVKEYARKINCDLTRAFLEFGLWEKAEHAAGASREPKKPSPGTCNPAFC